MITKACWDFSVSRLAEIVRKYLPEVKKHAEEAYPSECCGFIRESGITRCLNIADFLHEKYPEQYPQTSREAFVFSPQDLMQIVKQDPNDPVLVIYHSHPDADARFSAEDESFALWEGKPAYNVAHLIISIHSGASAEACLYCIKGGKVVKCATYD